MVTCLTVSQFSVIFTVFYNHNRLIHNALVSDFEGSNPSLTAK